MGERAEWGGQQGGAGCVYVCVCGAGGLLAAWGRVGGGVAGLIGRQEGALNKTKAISVISWTIKVLTIWDRLTSCYSANFEPTGCLLEAS